MPKNHVNTTAKIIKTDVSEQSYQLGQFVGNQDSNQLELSGAAKLNDGDINGNIDPVLAEIKVLANQLNQVQLKVTDIQNDGVKGRDLDKQLVEALKDLKNYALFFEKATFQMETKILQTSISIAQKIIAVEVGENSAKIAKETISNILEKIKTASKINIHLNPKDYIVLKNELNLESFIQLQEDSNVTAGGVVIASDLGNFDGSVEAKVETMLESLNSVI
ncbi:MAG: flagellar assembly protein FliH [Arcobacteraceae bacterium]|nr:flagellar assembly protein FliH [Arcobacteraceae bacterium]